MLDGPDGKPLKLVEVEIAAIENALRHSRGGISQAAAMLGIGRSTLYRKISEHGIEHKTLPCGRPRGTSVQVARKDGVHYDTLDDVQANGGSSLPPTAPMARRFPPGTFGTPEAQAELRRILAG